MENKSSGLVVSHADKIITDPIDDLIMAPIREDILDMIRPWKNGPGQEFPWDEDVRPL